MARPIAQTPLINPDVFIEILKDKQEAMSITDEAKKRRLELANKINNSFDKGVDVTL